MKKLLMAMALFGAATCSSLAQPPDGPGPQGPPPGPGPQEGPGPQAGPGLNRPSPEDFVNMAMRFDKDGDGKLNRDELMELARETQRGRMQGRGQQGGPPMGPPGRLQPVHNAQSPRRQRSQSG